MSLTALGKHVLLAWQPGTPGAGRASRRVTVAVHRDPETARYGLKGNVELSDAQKAFLARKKQMAAGEEVEVPTGPGGACSECGGAGERVCPACSGSGVNAKDQRKSDDEVFIMSPNVSDKIFSENYPCWLCRGKTSIPCKECAGMGLGGAWDAWQYE